MSAMVQQGRSWAELVEGFTGARGEVGALVDYCRFFSAEDAIGWALKAYNEALRDLRTPWGTVGGQITRGVPGNWVEDGVPWSSPRDFVDGFQHAFERRLWDACARSERYEEAERWFGRMPEFVAPQGAQIAAVQEDAVKGDSEVRNAPAQI